MSNLRWKVVTILTVLVVFSALGVYPIVAAHYGIRSPGWLMDKQLKLGLDLKGGVHLVLRVETEDALRLRLADEAVDADKVVAAALERARQWSRHPSVAFHHMKAAVRDPVLLRIRDKHDQHEEEWVDLWFSPPAQERLAQVREKLLARK